MAQQNNCWEFKDCKVYQDCPAHPSFGNICFSIEGTLCGGEVQGDYSQKIERCRKCDFYSELMENKK